MTSKKQRPRNSIQLNTQLEPTLSTRVSCQSSRNERRSSAGISKLALSSPSTKTTTCKTDHAAIKENFRLDGRPSFMLATAAMISFAGSSYAGHLSRFDCLISIISSSIAMVCFSWSLVWLRHKRKSFLGNGLLFASLCFFGLSCLFFLVLHVIIIGILPLRSLQLTMYITVLIAMVNISLALRKLLAVDREDCG